MTTGPSGPCTQGHHVVQPQEHGPHCARRGWYLSQHNCKGPEVSGQREKLACWPEPGKAA